MDPVDPDPQHCKGTTDEENVDSIFYLEVPHNGAGGAGNVLYPNSQLSAKFNG